MSEIEKMYKLANVQPYYKKRIECKEGYSIGQPCGKSPCIDCDKSVFEDVMPPFTAEKQIAILQLLTQRCDLTISHFTEWKFIHFDGQEPTQVTGKDFTETFAKLINAYWQDLTEEEKQQIKEILE